VDTRARTLEDAIKGTDVFFGVSVAGSVTAKMVKTMNKKPIIFALANPDPEITPEEARAARPDAIIATGRSDYPNQINNVLGFPYIFRGALDVRARAINDEMKVAAARALAALAREDVPDEVAGAYSGQRLQFGPDYLIPTPFDPRLISAVPPAVAEAAMKSGVARTAVKDMSTYRSALTARLDPTVGSLNNIFEEVKANPKRVVFAEGEEEKTIRAAMVFRNAGYGTPILIGRDDVVRRTMEGLGIREADALEIHNARLSKRNKYYTDYLYKRLQRAGRLYRDCQRMVNQDRNVFAACMVASGDADAMITGLTRASHTCRKEILHAIDVEADQQLFGLSIIVARERTVFVADTMVHEQPTGEQLADFAIQAAAKARMLGHEPRVALLSYSNFDVPPGSRLGEEVRRAVHILDSAKRDFAYDGEMTASVALDPALAAFYPFCRLGGSANVLIMPGLYSASISSRMLQKLGGGTIIGPLLVGLSKPAQVIRLDATVSDIVNEAVLAGHDAIKRKK
jgi:malate dehydrogenase (oxaloacetate-decarboxylating)(NADP+)